MDAAGLCLMIVCVCLLQSGTFGFHSGHFPSLVHVGSASVEHRLVHDRHRRATDPGGERPREIHTRVTSGRHDVTLRFKSLDGRRVAPLVHLNDRGQRVQHVTQNINCTMFYEDLWTGAHAMIDTCDQGMAMMAELYLDGAHHVILPQEGAMGEGGVSHSLYAVNASVNFTGDYNRGRSTYQPPPQHNAKSRQKRQATGSYLVELQIVIDYALYDYWYSITSTQKGGNARKRDTLEAIQSYYTFMARGMNFRYRKAADHSLNIGVELNEIYVLSTLGQSAITVGQSHVSGERDVIDGNVTLNSFVAWVADKRANEQGFLQTDHHMLLTYQDLASNGNNVGAGFAKWQKICTPQSCSVVEATFDFMTTIIAAHELGHSLGGDHDGYLNTCDSEDGFVLAATNMVKWGTERFNPFQFSTCSVASFVHTISNILDAQSNNCLLTNDIEETVPANGDPPGQIYDPDQQCKRIFGSGANMWRYNNVNDALTYSQICTGMACVLPGFAGELVIPADGTSCGNKKWCQNGVCVEDTTAAPTGDETCLYGDQPGELAAGLTCNSALEAHLGYCYSNLYLKQCCSACASRTLAIPDCAFGDTSNCEQLEDAQCYDEGLKGQCCKTCFNAAKKYTGYSHIPNCKYGNQAGNCVVQMCNQYASYCCSTCATLVTTQPPTTQPPTTQPPTTKPPTTQPPTTKATGPTQKPTTQPPTQPPTQAPTQPSTQATTPGPTQATTTKKDLLADLPDWVIPVAAGVGGLILLSLIAFLVYYMCCRKRASRSYRDRRDRYDRRSDRSMDRHYRSAFDNRGYKPDRRGFPRY